MNDFGRLRDGGEIEAAFLERLKLWLPVYVAEVDRQSAGWTPGGSGSGSGSGDESPAGKLPIPRSYSIASGFGRFPEDQLPAVLVIGTGTPDMPVKEREGYYTAKYTVGVAVFASTRSEARTRRVSQMYSSAVRGCILQKRSLSNVVRAIEWAGESYDDYDIEKRRTMFASVNAFVVELEEMVSWQHAPPPSWLDDPSGDMDPYPTEDPPEPTTVTHIDIDVSGSGSGDFITEVDSGSGSGD